MNIMSEPFMADELKWAGFDIMGLANNHSMDYMYEGLFATQENLDRVGIIHTGTGKNLEEASSPAFFDSENGRIALINCASTPYGSPEWALASATRGDVVGRPGVNPLRLSMTFQVTKQDLETLKKIVGSMMPQGTGWKPPEGDEFQFLRMGTFKASEEPQFGATLNKKDVQRITNAIKRAREYAHVVMVTIHDHGQRDYLETFAHACIDAGADCFFGSGPHVLRGLEIYKGKPIFYSLGNFLFQFLTVKQIPSEVYESTEMYRAMIPQEKYEEIAKEEVDNLKSPPNVFYQYIGSYFGDKEIFWTSVVPRIVFSDGKVQEIKLYPITLNPGADRADPLGRPFLADAEMGKKIVSRMSRFSKRYGTEIKIEKGIGVVNVEKELN
jgi:poly-gamma-glutamate synthesis protein (capsule biosynthesis protein)